MWGHRTPTRRNIFEAIYDRLAVAIMPPFLRSSCTPNQITILSGMSGMMGAVLLVFQDHLMLVLAAICIQIFAVLDLVDGNVARAKNMRSKFGQWLDIFFDKLNDFLLIAGLTIGTYRAIGHVHVLLLGMCLMGLVFSIQFVMVVNGTLLKIETNAKNNLDEEMKGRVGGVEKCHFVKRLARIVVQHCTLGHSAFLFLVSVFACINRLYFCLWFLTVHACATLVIIIACTFRRLWQHEKIPVS